MLLYAPHITPRLQYMAAWLGEQLQIALQLTDDLLLYRGCRTEKINYSPTPIDEEEVHLFPTGLLHKQGISYLDVILVKRHNRNVLFPTDDAMGFDFLSAVFYCISRYEEYMAYVPDLYGRYAHTNSLLFKGGCLQEPLVDLWLEDFRCLLRSKFPLLHVPEPVFRFIPTYDIDLAWRYQHKGWWRQLAGTLQQPHTLPQRIQVCMGKQPDPFDCYEWLNCLHQQYRFSPIYFFPMAERRSTLDKNISPAHTALQRLIQHQQQQGAIIGLHPSVYSNTASESLLQEKGRIERITGTSVVHSRHHFLRMHLPHSYRQLLNVGIAHDFTMGYGTVNGFRAGTSRSFMWYDLEREAATQLRIHPFAFMDANAYYEAKQTPQQALQELTVLCNRISELRGTCITIFHNHLLGNDPLLAAWRNMYVQFLLQVHGISKC